MGSEKWLSTQGWHTGDRQRQEPREDVEKLPLTAPDTRAKYSNRKEEERKEHDELNSLILRAAHRLARAVAMCAPSII